MCACPTVTASPSQAIAFFTFADLPTIVTLRICLGLAIISAPCLWLARYLFHRRCRIDGSLGLLSRYGQLGGGEASAGLGLSTRSRRASWVPGVEEWTEALSQHGSVCVAGTRAV